MPVRLHEYVEALYAQSDDVLDALLAEAQREGLPSIQVRPAVGKLLALLVKLSGAMSVLEIGTLAGYSAIWIEGLALAPDQLDFNFATSPSGNQLHNGGGMLLHGVNVGLEARW